MARTVPPLLRFTLEQFAQEFGGWTELKRRIAPATLEQILLFPGTILLVKPWQPIIDLKDYDYLENTPYYVFNSRWQHLYTLWPSQVTYMEEPPEEFHHFGYDAKDIAALTFTPHTDILYLCLHTLKGRRLLLLWVCNELRPEQIQAWIERLQKQYENRHYLNWTDHISLNSTYPAHHLRVLHVSAPPTPAPSPEDIRRNDTATVISDNVGIDPYIPLPFAGWYLVDLVTPQGATAVPLSNVQPNHRRIRVTPQGPFYVAGRNAAQFTADIHQLFNFEAAIQTAPEPLHLSADLLLPP